MSPEAQPYRFFASLETALPESTPDSILSRALHSDDHVRVTLFSFDEGQELSEHSSARPAILQVLEGTAVLGLGEDTVEADAGAWVFLPAGLIHSVRAKTPLLLLLTLLRA